MILHLAGKNPSYVKLRLRWLSDCFQGYSRNTKRTSAQHTAAVSEDKHGHFEGHGSLAFARQDTRMSSVQRRHVGRELGSRGWGLTLTLFQDSDDAFCLASINNLVPSPLSSLGDFTSSFCHSFFLFFFFLFPFFFASYCLGSGNVRVIQYSLHFHDSFWPASFLMTLATSQHLQVQKLVGCVH